MALNFGSDIDSALASPEYAYEAIQWPRTLRCSLYEIYMSNDPTLGSRNSNRARVLLDKIGLVEGIMRCL